MGFESTTGHDLKETVDTEKENSRGTLYKSFVEVVKRVKPKIFVAENVYGLLTMKNEPIKQIMKDFSDVGYDVDYQVVYCPEFGIPQTRKRVIIMGISKDRNIDIDTDWNIITKNKTTCNIGKYFEHLKEPDMTNDISQMVYSKAKKLEKGQGQKEVNMNSFAPTMRAEHHGNIEFRRHTNSNVNKMELNMPERRLTVREAGLIQTFSPDYMFSNKKNMTAYKYIGNAVPPLLGYLIADKVNELCNYHFD
jgi:DNA (cytosine-5)-methyltransferase 1